MDRLAQLTPWRRWTPLHSCALDCVLVGYNVAGMFLRYGQWISVVYLVGLLVWIWTLRQDVRRWRFCDAVATANIIRAYRDGSLPSDIRAHLDHLMTHHRANVEGDHE